MLHYITIANYTNFGGRKHSIRLSYELFGLKLHTAPIVLINHSLTGNSHITDKGGWWSDIVGENKVINTKKYTVLVFNIPGNGFDGSIIENYKEFVAHDIANLFILGLEKLKITQLYALIGASMGGGIAWEMVAINPDLAQRLVPIATDWKSTDWLIAHCQIQEQILLHSSQPLQDARMHAMLCYRTPESIKERFKRTSNQKKQVFNVESWLIHHGEKFKKQYQLFAYKLMNQLLKTIDITRNHPDVFKDLENSKICIHIIGVNSDLFFSVQENKDTYKRLAQAHSRVTYAEIQSPHGHDAFLIEHQQIKTMLNKIFNTPKERQPIKILKFGGKSLSNGKGIASVLSILTQKSRSGERIGVVLSGRGSATDDLEQLLEKAKNKKEYLSDFEEFQSYQQYNFSTELTPEFSEIQEILEGVFLLGDYSLKTKDKILSIAEVISAKVIVDELSKRVQKAVFIDTRTLIKTNNSFGSAEVIELVSKKNIQETIARLNDDDIPIFTGFIASNIDNETTTLGRNGSNYTAALIANFLDASELQNYTHIDGIYTANPDYVKDAKQIKHLSFHQANDMANLGTKILHAKTIIPLLEKNIPMRILNTFKENNKGTIISNKTSKEGIKALSIQENVTLVHFEGLGLLGEIGIDERVFKALSSNEISVNIIYQGSSERGLEIIVDREEACNVKRVLSQEFEADIKKDANYISINDEVSVISIIGQDLKSFHKPYSALIKNRIIPLSLNNTISGKNVRLVVPRKDANRALNVIHGQIFGVSKRINIAIFGHGNVGKALINQLLKSAANIEERKGLRLKIFAIANSKKVTLDEHGVSSNWEIVVEQKGENYTLDSILDFAKSHNLENLIAVDNTANETFVKSYGKIIASGFDIVSSNKIANTLDYTFYRELRKHLSECQKRYLYETNVGAGLPLIDTIKLLHTSGENITKITGVFSGSLSYIFNTFSESSHSFSSIVKRAITNGFTEPDAREDLSGNDVGRKLLVLARELDLKNELSDIKIQNLIPQQLQALSTEDFIHRLCDLDSYFNRIKQSQSPNHVLRYIGDLSGDLRKEKGELKVQLISVPKNSSLGQVKGSDSIIEIYTESYGKKPIIIQGAGAGAEVTARGVFGDILRLSE